MQHIETVTLSASQSSITFSAIPQDFTDLMITLSLRTDRASTADNIAMKVNNIITGYSLRAVEGNGSSASSFTDANQPSTFGINSTAANATAATFGNNLVYFTNYAGSSNKSYSVDAATENNATQAFQRLAAGLVSNSAAIQSLTFSSSNGTFIAGSTISLYGITAGSDGTTTVS